MAYQIYHTVTGERRKRQYTPGPRPSGNVAVLVELRPEQIAALRANRERCGGRLAVNEQVRRAVDDYLNGLTGICQSA